MFIRGYRRTKKILFLHVQPQLEHLIKQKPQFDTLIELQGCPSWARILSQPSYLVIVKADSLSELTWIGCEYLQLDVYAYVYEMASRRVQTSGRSMMNPLDSMCGPYDLATQKEGKIEAYQGSLINAIVIQLELVHCN